MNHAIFIGNLTADARQHLSADGKEFVTFDIAINQKRKGQNTVMYVSCYKTGSNSHLLPYLTKGQKVCVMGAIMVTAYTSRTGDAMAKLTLYASELELTGGRALVTPGDMATTTQPQQPQPNATTSATTVQPQQPKAATPTHTAEADTDDLPF